MTNKKKKKSKLGIQIWNNVQKLKKKIYFNEIKIKIKWMKFLKVKKISKKLEMKMIQVKWEKR